MGLELVFAIGLHHPGVADTEQMQGPSDAARLNRLPIPVEDENRLIEDVIHTPFPTIARKLTENRRSATQKEGEEPNGESVVASAFFLAAPDSDWRVPDVAFSFSAGSVRGPVSSIFDMSAFSRTRLTSLALSLPCLVSAADDSALVAVPGEPSLAVPEGVTVQVVADDKGQSVYSPTALTFDESGALYLAETHRFRFGIEDNRDHLYWLLDDLAAQTTADRRALHEKWKAKVPTESLTAKSELVRKLSEPDDKGVFTKSGVYAEGFNDVLDGTAAGVFAMNGTVFLASIPKLWALRDNDGDGKADERGVIQDGFGVRVSFSGHDMNGFALGPDGRIYGTIGDRGFNVTTREGRKFVSPDRGAVFRFEPDGTNFEVVHSGLRNPKEIAFDAHGNAFTVDNNSDQGDKARVVYVVEGGDSGWEMGHQALHSFHREIGLEEHPPNRWMAEKMWEPENDSQPSYILPPVANLTSGPSGLTYHPGAGFLDREAGRFLICDYKGSAAASGIWSFKVEPSGAGMKLADARQALWGIAATDVEYAWNGDLYVTDFLGGWTSHEGGRVLKIFPSKVSAKGSDAAVLIKEGFEKRTPEELAKLLGHADQRVRLRAQLALTRKPASLEFFKKAVASAGPIERLHGVWGLGILSRRGSAILPTKRDEFVELPDQKKSTEATKQLIVLLKHQDPEVRAQAVKVLAESRVSGDTLNLGELLLDPSPRVRMFAAITIGKLKAYGLVPQIWEMIEANADKDPYLRHAGAYALELLARDPRQVSALSTHQSPHVRLAAVVALRRMKSPELARFVGDADLRVSAEALRAIHDEGIEEVRSVVAAQLDEPAAAKQSPFMQRRFIHSAFRLGDQENVARLLKVAATPDFPLETRAEVIRLLSIWPEPPPVDQSTGRFAPLPKRDLSLIRDSLIEAVPELLKQDDTLAAVLDLVSRFELSVGGLDGASIRELLEKESLPGVARAKALALYAALKPADLAPLLVKISSQPDDSLALQSLRLLADLFPQQATQPLLTASRSKKTARAQEAWLLMAGFKDPAVVKEMVTALRDLQKTKGISPSALELLSTARTRTEPEVQQALAAFEASLKGSTAPLAPHLSSLEGGDADRGAALFESHPAAQCLRCHRAEITGDSGSEAGPNLFGVATRGDRRYLLESLVLPSAKVVPGYGIVSVSFSNGASLSGRLLAEKPAHIDLESEGKAWRVKRKDIASLTPAVSAMPPMHALLKPGELRDLVAWLATLDQKAPATKPAADPPLLDPATLKK